MGSFPHSLVYLTLLQVEFANVILLNKADLVTEADLVELESVVRRLNSAARVVRTVSSDVDLAEVLGTGEFDLDEVSQAAGWLQVHRMFVYVVHGGVSCNVFPFPCLFFCCCDAPPPPPCVL